MIVVDSNVLSARVLTGALTRLAERLEQKDPVWIAPPLWRYEIQNILTKTVWAGYITLEKAGAAWRQVASQMHENEYEPPADQVLDLATRHRISAYDANFVALALRMDIPCITEDRELQKKFPGVAIGMADFLRQDLSGGRVRESRVPYGTRPRSAKRRARRP